MWNRRIQGGVLLAGAIMLAACDDATGPEMAEPFDAEAALDDYQTVDQVLDSDAFRAFQALDGRTPFSGPASVALVSELARERPEDFSFDLLRRARAAADAPPVGRAPIISNWTRGATYIYDSDQDQYVLAPGRDGAPETGVRFILYDVDAEGTPILDQEMGFADLIDEGDDSAEDVVLRLVVVSGERTFLDYRTTLDMAEDQGTLTVAGFAQGESTERLDFDIQVQGREAEGREEVDLDFTLAVESRNFEIDGRVRGMEEDDQGDGAVEIAVRHGSDSMELELAVTDGLVDGAVRLNGELFATASGPEDDPTFVDPDGEALSFRELLVLREIADSVEDVFDLVEDLLDPVDDLVILGIIL